MGGGNTPSPEGTRHWRTVGGLAPTAQTLFARNGGKAYRFKPIGTVGQVSFLRHDPNPTTGTTRWGRGYVYFNALPSTDADIMTCFTAASKVCRVQYRTATQDIIAKVDTTTTGATAVPVVVGQWYRIECAADVSGASSTMKLTVDGVDKGTATQVLAASTITQFNVGAQCSGGTGLTADVIWDDIISGPNNADYPVGAGQVVGLSPNADGTHNSSTAGDFVYNAAGGNIDPAATDTYTYINHSLDAISSFLAAALAATGEYLEWQFQDMPSVSSINGVEVVSAHHGFDGNANLQSMKINDGGTLGDVFLDYDFSQTTLVYNTKCFATAPSSGVAWTKAKVDALKVRWGSSFTAADVTPDPYIDAVMLEVDYVPVSGTTRFYFPYADLAHISPAVDANWERSISAFVRNRAVTTKAESSMSTVASHFGDVTTSQTCWGQWITPPLNADTTINQPVSMVMRCQENTLQENAHLAFSLRVLKPDGTFRGTLKLQHATATEFPTSGATRIHSSIATSSVSALTGDRLVMEVGVHAVTPENIDDIILEWGAASAIADHALAEGNTSSLVPWWEIAQTLTFDPEPATGTGTPTVTLVSSVVADATQTFVGTGTPTKTLSSSVVADATQTFVGSGTPTKTLSVSAVGTGTLTFTAFSGAVKALVVSASGTATNVADLTPPPRERAKGGKVRFIDQADEKEPPPPKPRPKPKPAPDATPLAEVPSFSSLLRGSTHDPMWWHAAARFRPDRPYFPEQPAPVELSVGDRFMQKMAQGVDTPDFMKAETSDQFLEQFLRHLGMEP